MAVAGLSSVGVTLGYGVGASKPSTMTQLTRVSAIGGISISTEQLDASALEDKLTRYIAGRGDTGGEWTLTFLITNDTVSELTTMIGAYDKTGATKMYFEVIAEGLDKAFWAVVQPPTAIPMPEIGQNEVLTVEMSMTVEEYIGLDTKVDFQ